MACCQCCTVNKAANYERSPCGLFEDLCVFKPDPTRGCTPSPAGRSPLLEFVPEPAPLMSILILMA